MPAAAIGNDAASAEAFVKFYWESVNYAQKTGDVTQLRTLSTNCRGCDAGITFITDVYEGGGSIEGGDGRVTNVDVGFIGDSNERAIVDFEVVSSKQEVDRSGADDDETFPGGRQAVRIILDPDKSGWVAVYMGAK